MWLLTYISSFSGLLKNYDFTIHGPTFMCIYGPTILIILSLASDEKFSYKVRSYLCKKPQNKQTRQT